MSLVISFPYVPAYVALGIVNQCFMAQQIPCPSGRPVPYSVPHILNLPCWLALFTRKATDNEILNFHKESGWEILESITMTEEPEIFLLVLVTSFEDPLGYITIRLPEGKDKV